MVIDMRELTLFETGYLAGLLLLSLLLPLLLSFRGPHPEATKRLCMRTVWTGQWVLASAGLAVLVSTRIAPYAAAGGMFACFCCALVLLRQFRAMLRLG